MRIIDWSSDVCSSDLLRAAPGGGRLFAATWHTLTPTPLPLRRRGAGVPRPATTLCYSSPDGAPRHRVPLERPHARPRADGDVPALLVAPVPRRPAVRIRRRTVVHDGVCDGAAVDGGVRSAVGVPGVRPVELGRAACRTRVGQ